MRIHCIRLMVLLSTALMGTLALAGPDLQREVAAIRQLYADLVMVQGLSRTVVAADEFSSEGGELQIYKDAGGQVRRLISIFRGKTGKTFCDYALQGGKLRYVYERQDRYNHHIARQELGEVKVLSYTEHHFYFTDGKLIEWENERHERVSPTSPEFKEAERRRLEVFQALRQKIR